MVKCSGGCGRTLSVSKKHYDEADEPKDKAFTCFWCSEGIEEKKRG